MKAALEPGEAVPIQDRTTEQETLNVRLLQVEEFLGEVVHDVAVAAAESGAESSFHERHGPTALPGAGG